MLPEPAILVQKPVLYMPFQKSDSPMRPHLAPFKGSSLFFRSLLPFLPFIDLDRTLVLLLPSELKQLQPQHISPRSHCCALLWAWRVGGS